MSSADIQDMVVDGGIKMTCEFCSTDYVFDPSEIQKGETT
jgi:redox-regulated HSP33 family molecular chaperone